MRLTKLVLVVAVSLVIAGILVWQRTLVPSSMSADVSAAPAKEMAVQPIDKEVEVAKEVAPVAAPAPAPKPATTRARRATAPATVATKNPENAASPTPSAAPEKELPRMTYEQRVTDATKAAGEDLNRGLGVLQQLSNEEPNRPEAYEAMAGIRLRNHQYTEAHEAITRALAHGGKATFALLHDHTSGSFETRDPKATCVGELTIVGDELTFASSDAHFTASWAEIRDTGANKFFGNSIGGFHVTLNQNKKYKNFNLAPQSRDKAEGQLILDLLKAHTAKH